MKSLFAFFAAALLSSPLSHASSACSDCKNINEKIQGIVLEAEPGVAIDLLVDLSTYIRKMKFSTNAEVKKRQYLTLFEASFKLEDHDMDLEIPEILGGLYKKNKKEFLQHLNLLPEAKQKKILYKMKLINIYIHFGEGSTYKKFIEKNPVPKSENP